MSYFSTTRPRAYSKPTREELKELSYHLSQRSEHELRQICQAAVTESTEVAHVLMKVMRDASLLPNDHLSEHDPSQPSIFSDVATRGVHSDIGLPTPVDMAEDSEMGGIENMVPSNPSQSLSTSFSDTSNQTYSALPHSHAPSPSSSQRPHQIAALATSFARLHSSTNAHPVPTTGSSLPTSFSPIQSSTVTQPNAPTTYNTTPLIPQPTTQISNKRKSLADRDDNVPTHFPNTMSAGTKKRCTAFPLGEYQTQHQQQHLFLQF